MFFFTIKITNVLIICAQPMCKKLTFVATKEVPMFKRHFSVLKVVSDDCT